MDARRPVELISEAEDKVARLEKDLRKMEAFSSAQDDLFLAASNEITALHDALKARTAERDALAAERTGLYSIAEVGELLANRDQHIAKLNTLLAQRPAPVPDTPKPVHDFTRVAGGDRRMLGG
jgi:hypothetical protein